MEISGNTKFEFLGEELLKIRKQKGLSQEELADKINVSRQSIHLWESGKIKPDLENIIALCTVLEITTDKLTSGLEIINQSKPHKNNKTLIKIIIMILFIIAFFIFINIIRRVVIINKINSNTDNFKSLNNFSYKITTYNMKDNVVYDLLETQVYYKDGIYKRILKENNEDINILWVDYKANEGYVLDLKENNYREYSHDEIPFFAQEQGIYQLRESAIESNNFIVTIMLSINPFYSIKSTNNNYIITYIQNGQSINTVKTWIDKETGLPINKIHTIPNNKDNFEEIQYNFNNVNENDIKRDDLNNYTKV